MKKQVKSTKSNSEVETKKTVAKANSKKVVEPVAEVAEVVEPEVVEKSKSQQAIELFIEGVPTRQILDQLDMHPSHYYGVIGTYRANNPDVDKIHQERKAAKEATRMQAKQDKIAAATAEKAKRAEARKAEKADRDALKATKAAEKTAEREAARIDKAKVKAELVAQKAADKAKVIADKAAAKAALLAESAKTEAKETK